MGFYRAADSSLSVEQREDAVKQTAEPWKRLGTPPTLHLAWNTTHPLTHLA